MTALVRSGQKAGSGRVGTIEHKANGRLRRPCKKSPRVSKSRTLPRDKTGFRAIFAQMVTRVSTQYRMGWNAALRRMHRALAELPGDRLTDTLAILVPITRGLRLRKPRGGKNAELARKYNVSLRTINNWRAAGCSFAHAQPARALVARNSLAKLVGVGCWQSTTAINAMRSVTPLTTAGHAFLRLQ